MDPATLAAEAVAFVTPYLLDFAKNLGADAQGNRLKGSTMSGRCIPPPLWGRI